MKKEIHICDRCGKEIEYHAEWDSLRRRLYRHKLETEIEAKTLQRGGYLEDKDLSLADVKSMNVVEYYDLKRKEYHLCPDCRKDFKRFMKNENIS